MRALHLLVARAVQEAVEPQARTSLDLAEQVLRIKVELVVLVAHILEAITIFKVAVAVELMSLDKMVKQLLVAQVVMALRFL
jgi:hypothetical protein